MTSARRALANQLRIQCSLPPDRPSDNELDSIIEDIDAVVAEKGCATIDDWRAATRRHVRFDGTYFYKGVSFQDLNALLATLRAQTQSAQAARK